MFDSNYDWYLTDRFGKKIFFNKSQIIIGRKDCDILLKSTSVNYKHCVISINDDDKKIRIKDFKTANGTFVNDKQIITDEFLLLNVGDKIRLAYDQITYTVSKNIAQPFLGTPSQTTCDTSQHGLPTVLSQSRNQVSITPGSPIRGSDIPCLVTDPEKSMASALCELSDSVIDLNTTNNSQLSSVNQNNDHDIVERKEHVSEIEEKLENCHEEVRKDADQSFCLSKPAETFTIDFNFDDIKEIDNAPAGVNRFGPSKLRSSVEERERVKRTKTHAMKSSNKTDTSSPRSTESSSSSKNNGKILTTTLQSSKTTKVKVNSKIEEKSPAGQRILSNRSKTADVDRHSKTISQLQGQRERTSYEPLKKLHSVPASKDSTKILSKKNSKSDLSDKVVNSDETKGTSRESVTNIQSLPSSKDSTPKIRNKNSKSYLLDKRSLEDNDKFQSSKDASSFTNKIKSKANVLEKIATDNESCCENDEKIKDESKYFSTSMNRKDSISKLKGTLSKEDELNATSHNERTSKNFLKSRVMDIKPTEHDSRNEEHTPDKYEPSHHTKLTAPAIVKLKSSRLSSENSPLNDKPIETCHPSDDPIQNFRRNNPKSKLLEKMPNEDKPFKEKDKSFETLPSNENSTNPSLCLLETLPINVDSLNVKDESIERNVTFPMSKSTTPTLSKKNSKLYLLEKMLLGDESSQDFQTYEESKSVIICNNDDVPDSSLKINSDIKGSFDNLSEAGTYVIEGSVDGKTVNLDESDDTLGKDNSSSISSHHISPDKELESKSSGKWLSEYPCDDVVMNSDAKNKRTVNSKFTGSSMPHIPSDDYLACNKRDNSRDDEPCKSNYNCLVSDNRHRSIKNSDSKHTNDDNNNKKKSNSGMTDSQQQYDINLQNAYSSYSNTIHYVEGQSGTSAEKVYGPDVSVKSTVPSYNTRNSGFQEKLNNSDTFSSTQFNVKNNPRSTFSVASLDTALLLQDTEALLNDMEKRVYCRKDKRDETIKSQSFSANMSHGEKIPFVDEAEEKEENPGLFTNSNEIDENVRLISIKPSQSISYIEPTFVDDKNRSYAVRSPMNSGNIRRNNSCKMGISESMTMSRKANTTVRNQRSCSMIEEQRQNHLSNNNNIPDSFCDYRSKSKPSVLAMNSGIFMNRRGSSGISSAINSPVSRLEPATFFNNGFSVQRSKDVFPYFSTNMLSLHRQRFNRYEYGQHSLKYNSNSTTMIYNKNSRSPPWNGEDTIISPNSFYPSYDSEYYAYNTLPESLDTSMLTSKHEHNSTNNNSQNRASSLELNTEIDYNKREEISEFLQPCYASGRSSAFSPVNSLHQSAESVNNYLMTSKSRSSLGLNDQRNCNYDTLLVSSVHQYSARLCRYAEEIVHRVRREGSDYPGNSPVETPFDQIDSFGQLKSVNRELQETVINLRSLEKQLQRMERFIFPIEKSGRNSTAGSCTEDNYLNQLERINKELKDFVPIDDVDSLPGKVANTKEGCLGNVKFTPSKDTAAIKTVVSDTCSLPTSKFPSTSKRYQNRKE